MVRVGILLNFAGALLLVACGPPRTGAEVVELRGETMGTTYTVKVVPAPGVPPAGELAARVQAALDDVNAKMSTYLADSEVSRLSRWRQAEPFPVSTDLLTVLRHAEAVSRASGGAFDVTVAPLVEAWGFGPGGRPPSPPPAAELAAIRAHVGWRLLELAEEPPAVRKLDPEVSVDLSAIAKGYGVDRVAAALASAGVTGFMVEVGGEVRTAGLSASGRPWRIAIERPVAGRRELQLVVPLSGQAMATSGDYRNFYEVDGQRFSHTLDPRTGEPVAHTVAAVSVVAADCMTADAWATALLVLGPEGPAVADGEGLAAYFLTRRGGHDFEATATAPFRRLLAGEEAAAPAVHTHRRLAARGARR